MTSGIIFRSVFRCGGIIFRCSGSAARDGPSPGVAAIVERPEWRILDDSPVSPLMTLSACMDEIQKLYQHAATQYIVSYSRGSSAPCPVCTDRGSRILSLARRVLLPPSSITFEDAVVQLHRFDMSTLWGPRLSLTRAERFARYKRFRPVPVGWEWVEAILRQFPALAATMPGNSVEFQRVQGGEPWQGAKNFGADSDLPRLWLPARLMRLYIGTLLNQ